MTRSRYSAASAASDSFAIESANSLTFGTGQTLTAHEQ